MNRLLRLFFVCASALTIAGSASANSIIVLQFDPALSSVVSAGAQYTIGWKFTVNAAVTVVALDAYDPEPGSGHVQLYDSGHNILASANLSLSDPIVGAPQGFYSQPIPWVVLNAGQTYYIAESYDGLNPAFPQFYANAVSVSTVPQITYGGAVLAAGLDQLPTADSMPMQSRCPRSRRLRTVGPS
jgi:hypothetical protein